MGNRISAEDSIKELENKQSLIKKYFDYSSSINNFMGYKCCKTKIPGNEIKSDFTFYLYNIEGFFDIENGFFFTLQNLILSMKYFNESKIDTKSWKDFSVKIKIFLGFLQTLAFIENVDKYYIKDRKEENQNTFKIFMDYVKNNKEFSEIASFGIALLRNSDYVINFLESIIPFEQFKGYVSSVFLLIEGGFEIYTGIKVIPKVFKAFSKKNYFEAIVYLIDGTYNFVQGAVNAYDSYNQIKENYCKKKFTKAQRNLNALLNKMDLLFDELKKNNLNELYKNNVVVLAIDETNKLMEDPDIRLINVKGIENYAKSLDNIDCNRHKFFMNMIIFYLQLKNIISSDEYENKDFKLRYGFMLHLKKIILEQYNQQSWNSMDEENIIHLINDKYQEYYDNLNELDDDKKEIDDKEKKVTTTNNKIGNTNMEKRLLTKTPSLSLYSFKKKNENNNNNTKNPEIIEEEKKNQKIFYNTNANGFYKKKIIHKNTNDIDSTNKSLLKSESNYCKTETVNNQDEKISNNFQGYRVRYKRKNNDKILYNNTNNEHSTKLLLKTKSYYCKTETLNNQDKKIIFNNFHGYRERYKRNNNDKILYNNTNNVHSNKSLLKSETNYCKTETLNNQDKKISNNFQGYRARYKRKNNDKILYNNTNNVHSTKLLLKTESNYCKTETLNNQDKKIFNNFHIYRERYKRRNNDKIICQDLSLKDSAPPPIGVYFKKINNFENN